MSALNEFRTAALPLEAFVLIRAANSLHKDLTDRESGSDGCDGRFLSETQTYAHLVCGSKFGFRVGEIHNKRLERDSRPRR